MKKIIVKPDAKPIDNVTKFAWDDSDYIEVDVPDPPKPEPQPSLDERISDCELVLAEIMGGAI